VTIKRAHQGFAVLDPELQREIASKGGKAAHAQGKAYEFTPEKAREAGKKGGEAVSRDRAHMARIGAMGGRMKGRNKKKAAAE